MNKLLFLILLIFSKTTECNDAECKSNEIPKHIWTFWDTDEVPELVSKCIQTWKDTNPEYEVTLVQSSNLAKYVGEEEAEKILKWKFIDNPQRLSNLVRLELLAQHGGIYLDASTVVYESFAWVHKFPTSTVMYSILERASEPLLDNWFIATTKGSKFVTEWNTEHRNIDKFPSIQHYVDLLEPTLLSGIENPIFFLMYLINRKIHRKHLDDVTILNTSDGPMNYLLLGGIKSLCQDRKEFAKLRRQERAEVTENPDLENCLFGVIDKKPKEEVDVDTLEIPKIIWTFWDTYEIPGLIERCIQTWRELNKDHKINVVTKYNLQKYVGEEEAGRILNWKFIDSPQRLSNLVRLEVLSQHGGIYLDASSVMYESLDWVHKQNKRTVIFSIRERRSEPLLDNWFIATTKKNPFIVQWNKEHRNMEYFPTIRAFLDVLEPELQDGVSNPEYFTMYVVSRKFYRKYKSDIKVLNTSDGPLKYLINDGLKYLCVDKPKFVKLRRDERRELYNNQEELEKCLFGKKDSTEDEDVVVTIPKVIWTFWDSDELPNLVKKCINTWKTLNPDYKINVVTSSTLSDHLPEEEAEKILNWKFNDTPQRLSQLIKLELIERYGGIWLDASTVLYKSLDWVHEHQPERTCSVFSILERTREPLPDSWFLACPPKHPFITEWNKEHRRVGTFVSIREYIELTDPTLLQGIGHAEQFLMYVVGRRSLRKHIGGVRLLSTSDGPLGYVLKGGLKSLCKDRSDFVKLRRDERREIADHPELERCLFEEKQNEKVKTEEKKEEKKVEKKKEGKNKSKKVEEL